MAVSTKLSLTFTDGDGASINHSYNYANPEVTSASVKALMQGIVANGAIFDRVPVATKSAKIVVTEETSININ